MGRLLLGVLIGLVIGVPAGAAAWHFYDDEADVPSEERERANTLVNDVLLRIGCPVCTVTRLDQTAPGAWRADVEYTNSQGPQRFCFRIVLDTVRASDVTQLTDLLDGSTPGLRKTACA